MSTFLAWQQSFEYWVANGAARCGAAFGAAHQAGVRPTRARPRPGQAPNAALIRELGLPYGIRPSDTVHLVVADAASRSRAAGITCQVWNGPERGSYFQVDDEYCVSSPEACFMQYAASLKKKASTDIGELAKLVFFGYQLCGTFVIDPRTGYALFGRTPLTSADELARFARRMEGARGSQAARRALGHILDNAASPMEAILAMHLTLPCSLGGHGLPKPELNHRINLPAEMKAAFGKSYYVCDLFWPGAHGRPHVALEYDGREHHAGEPAIEKDTQRRNDLGHIGIHMLGATSLQLRTVLSIENLAAQVAKAIGFRPRSKQGELPARRFALWQALSPLYGGTRPQQPSMPDSEFCSEDTPQDPPCDSDPGWEFAD